MKTPPVDWGWLGLLLILVNGFFFSVVLDTSKIGVVERLLLTIGLGFGLTFMVMVLLGILWEISLLSVLITQLTLIAVLGATAFLLGFRIKINQSPYSPSEVASTHEKPLQTIPLAIIGVLGAVALYNTLTLPAIEWDSLAYGVNYAKIIYQAGHIPLIAGPSIGIEMSAPYPPGVQLSAVCLYSYAESANDFYYRLLSPIFSLATLIVTYKFALLLTRNRVFSVFAVSALAMIPFFWELFIEETYIMALAFMLTSAAYFYYKAYVSDSAQSKKYEVIGVLLCAFAALTSYMGLMAFGIVLLYALHKRIPVKRGLVLLLLGLAVILPWYLRNLVLLGDPIYPFLGIGYYLDPLLRSSTAQHFQDHTLIAFYAYSALSAKIGAVLVAVAVAFLTFSKRRKLRLALPLYLLLVSLGTMALHVAFPRYLILAIPILCVVFSTLFLSVPKKRNLSQIAAVAFIVVMVLTSAVMLPYINTVKPQRVGSETQAEYLSRVYAEGDAWQWINEKTPADTRIATFDIKAYYLNRDIFYLDGNESAPLYKMSTIEDCLSFLRSRGVGYVLSVPWASQGDPRMPVAYNQSILAKYLGDADYLPPVFAGINGTAVYHVGALNIMEVNEAFARKGVAEDMAALLIAPFKYQNIPLNFSKASSSNETNVAACHIPIPVDYRGGKITISVNSTNIILQLWNELLPANQLQQLFPKEIFTHDGNFLIADSPESGNFPSTLYWEGKDDKGIDNVGYFTIRVLDKSGNLTESPVNLEIRFYNVYDLAST